MSKHGADYNEQFTDVCPTCKGEGSVPKGTPQSMMEVEGFPELVKEYARQYYLFSEGNGTAADEEKALQAVLNAYDTNGAKEYERGRAKGMAEALLKVSLCLPFVSDGDPTEYAKGVRATVNNLRLDIAALISPQTDVTKN